MSNPDCLFCKIAAKEAPSTIVSEDDDILVFKDLYPSAPVHLLVIPKKHISSLFDLTDEDEALMGKIVRALPKLAKEHGLDRGFKPQINTGKGGGQEVMHIHFHPMGRP